MPDVELRADFDHDGRLTGSQSEYDARHTQPGALLVANTDADRRRLPNQVIAGPEITLDYEQPTKTGGDDELLSLGVRVVNPSATAGQQLLLRVPGLNGVRVRIYDDRGVIVQTPDASQPGDHPITLLSGNQLNFMLEARTYPGSPFGHAMSLSTIYAPDSEDESRFEMQLLGRDSSNRETVFDSGNFSVAPVLFLDNGVRATRLYICDNPDTQAALVDVRSALSGIPGVELVTVPADVSAGDTWLQDQFQPGIVVGGDGWRHAIVHLPRMRSNFVGIQRAQNLAQFVRSHFPAHNVGVMHDFWARSLSFSDATGQQQTLQFQDCVRLANVMDVVYALIGYFDEIASRLDRTPGLRDDQSWTDTRRNLRNLRSSSWSEARQGLPDFLAPLRSRIVQARSNATTEQDRVLQATLDDVNSRTQRLNQRLPLGSTADRFVLPVNNRTMEVDGERADELFQRIQQMQGSASYGGNIESAPPTATAPLGKIVIGNALIYGRVDHIDPDLLRFLYKQRQPVVEVDSTWLDVGHVDEMLVFVPDRNGSGQRFAALRASSGLALKIIQAAADQYQRGLPQDHPQRGYRRPSGVLERLTNSGTSPVTRLFRGKLWSHSHRQPTGPDDVPDVLEPPRIYPILSQAFNGGDPSDPSSAGINIHDIHYWPGVGPDRAYPADITVLELLYAESDDDDVSVNAFIEQQFLAPLDRQLGGEFDGMRIFPMPVLFDRISSVQAWRDDRWKFSTSAFSPDVINMQVLNNHLLIPRPYGPRMGADDALTVLTNVLKDIPGVDSLRRQLNARFFRRFGLTTTTCWIIRQDPVYRTSRGGSVPPLTSRERDTLNTVFGGITTIEDVARFFKDGFPDASDQEVANRILRDNRRNFTPDGQLRDGWRRFVIHEDMVDLFEAYIQLAVNALGLMVDWVDTWFYHVHFGGIHCGTNVLRVPEPGQMPNWWK